MVNRALVDALARRARKRKRRKGLQPAQFPRGPELEYVRALKALSREVSELIRKRIFPLLEQERHDAETKPVPMAVTRVLEGLRVEIADKITGHATGVSGKMVSQVAESSRKALNAEYYKVLGLRPWENNDSLRAAMAQRLRENVGLIQSIPNQQLEQVGQVVAEGWASGTRVETIRKQIEERFDVSQSRAELIARDQVGKLNAQLNQERQESLGVTTYTWQSSSDSRVRPMHRDLDGTTHRWDDPPITNEEGDRNHPGQDYQCRCNAVADIEGVLQKLGL